MESTSLIRPLGNGGKGLVAKQKSRKIEKEFSVEKPRSLSRQKMLPQAKTRLEDSKTLVATPRGSLLEQCTPILSSAGTAKVFKLLSIKKERFLEEAGSARGTANLAVATPTTNYMQLQFNIQQNGMASSAGFVGLGGSTKKSSAPNKVKSKKEILHTLGPVPTKKLGFTRESKSREREQLFHNICLRSPVELKNKYDLRTSLVNAGATTAKKESKTKKKEKNSSVMKVTETPTPSTLLQGVVGNLKDKQLKEYSTKPKLKKKLTLDDDEFIPTASSGWLETKHGLNSPKEDSSNHNKQALDRIEKCLGDRQMKVSGSTAMKQSFKGGLSNEIKMQAWRMARKGSKEFDTLNIQPGGYFEGLADLDYTRSLPYSHRDLTIKRPKDLIVDTLSLGLNQGGVEEMGPYRNLHIKTDISISADKKSSPYHSPTKIAKVTFGLSKKVKSKGESTNVKKSPKRRSGRASKPTTTYSGMQSAIKNSNIKETNKSLEKNYTKVQSDYSTLRTSAGAKTKHHKISKVCPLIISNYGEAGLEGSARGSNFSSTLIASKCVQEYSSVRIKVASRTQADHNRPRLVMLPPHLSLVGLEPTNPVPPASRLAHSLKQLNRRVSRLAFQREERHGSNQPKDAPEKVYESRPEYPDGKPLPFNLGDVRTIQQIPSLAKQLKPSANLATETESCFRALESGVGAAGTKNKRKKQQDMDDEELFENDLNLPMEKPFPAEESVSSSLYSNRGRVRPIIGGRPGSNIAVTTTF